jgi:hypothetical protein
MKPLFTREELTHLRQIDQELERRPLSRRELREARARDEAIAAASPDLRAGKGTIAAVGSGGKIRPPAKGTDLAEGWFERARAARFASTRDAARACRVSDRLMWYLECGSVTAPELARRIGRVLKLSRAQIDALTCWKSVERRRAERLERVAELCDALARRRAQG